MGQAVGWARWAGQEVVRGRRVGGGSEHAVGQAAGRQPAWRTEELEQARLKLDKGRTAAAGRVVLAEAAARQLRGLFSTS